MPEMINKLLDKIVSSPKWVSPAEIKEKVSHQMKDGVGIIEAVSQVFWVRIENGLIKTMRDADPMQTNPVKWLTARFFNKEMELRFHREGEKFKMTSVSEKGITLTDEDYRVTEWLLSGKGGKVKDNEQLMEEFLVAPYWMPKTDGKKAPVLCVRQYIDYEAATGLAKIVAERFIEIGEENKNE